MEPRAYIPAYLEREYLRSHSDLTPAARELLHSEISTHPEKYATSPHAHSLMAYMQVRDHMLAELDRMEELSDEEYERKRTQLFGETRLAVFKLGEADQLNVDAHLLDIMLAEVPLDNCIADLISLENHVRSYLNGSVPAFDSEAPHFWDEGALYRADENAAARTASEPEVVGWLHTVEALAQLCLASARYKAAAQYARQVMRAEGYPNNALGTLLLALARLEDEDGFFEAAGTPVAADGTPVETSPWYLLGRTLLLFKLGRRKNATRALRAFATQCDGGAFFLLNPTYLVPYLPVRPPVHEAWKLSHQAVWEADGIVVDTPDFAPWATSVSGVEAASEEFARRHGF